MKNALRPSLLPLIIWCSWSVFAQTPHIAANKTQPPLEPVIASAPAPTACSNAVNYAPMDTVYTRSSANTSASKSMWYQCASADAISARTYLDRTALDIPLAKAEGAGLVGLG